MSVMSTPYDTTFDIAYYNPISSYKTTEVTISAVNIPSEFTET